MTFNDDAQLDTSQVTGGGGGGGGRGGMIIGGGGGILAVIVYILMQVLGGGNSGGENGTGAGSGVAPMNHSNLSGAGDLQGKDLFSNCKTGKDANTDDNCLVVGTVNSVQDYWKKKLPESTKDQKQYKMVKTVIYSGQTQSACGTASNQVGPFYCPLDKQAFVDASFFQLLSKRFGADGGQFAKEYVVAHEYGHAVQDQLGVLDAAQQDPQGPASGGVRVELMADCFAGMWAKAAPTTKDANGQSLFKEITEADIKSALSAASAVGDDTIQKKTQGRVSPENFTHGTSEQRMRWFMNGYNNQNINSCNTLKANPL